MQRSRRSSRRQFLQSASATAAIAALPISIQRALAMSPARETGTIADVQHVVMLMQENRSFDSYFGTMPGVRGFGDRFTIPLPDGRTVWQQKYVPLNGGTSRIVQPYPLSEADGNAQHTLCTPHGWTALQGGWDDGRKADWPTFCEPRSMGYNVRGSLPFQFALAEHFTVCDAYHCSVNGPTHPNRRYVMSGGNVADGLASHPATDNFFDKLGPSSEGFEWTSYPELLETAGISWKVYQTFPDRTENSALHGFRSFRRANEQKGNAQNGAPYPLYDPADNASNPLLKGVSRTAVEEDFFATMREDIRQGVLPQVSYVLAPYGYDEYPDSSSPIQGGWFIDTLLSVLTENPDVWRKTVLIVHFDENDGLFDHMPHPAPPALCPDGSYAGKSSIPTHGEYVGGQVIGLGARIPATIVSPWTRGGWVNSQTFDHTSIVQFLEKRFGVISPHITPYRRAVCGDLTSCFDFTRSDHAMLPATPYISKHDADARRRSQDALPSVPVPSEASQTPPLQPFGMRPSRALPYQMNATASVDATRHRITLRFENTGSAAAVLHVYDKRQLDAIPRRYTVDAGAALTDEWDLPIGPDGRRSYDLWVGGPNGFHRAFVGSTQNTFEKGVDIRSEYRSEAGTVVITLLNDASEVRSFVLTSDVYHQGAPVVRDVAPRSSQTIEIRVVDSGYWYDIAITLQHIGDANASDDAAQAFLRRCAGRMETGYPSTTDPAYA